MPPLETEPTKVHPIPAGGTPYKVGGKDDWYSVAQKFKVNVQRLILFNCGTLNSRVVNWYLRTRVGCRIPSKWNWTFEAASGHIHIPPSSPVQLALQVYTYSIAALSWIDPRTGLPEVDAGDPGDGILRAAILANRGYRFANFLEATVSIMPTGIGPMQAVFGHTGYTADCGIYRALSFAGIPSYAYPIKLFDPVTVDGGVEFRQIVGARTQSAEVLAAKAPGPFGAVGGAIAQKAVPLPPIWSDLRLTIRYDGTYAGELVAHSLFPSLTYYENSQVLCLVMDGSGPCQAYDKKSGYDGMPNYKRWMDDRKGWGRRRDTLRAKATRGGRPGPIPVPPSANRRPIPTRSSGARRPFLRNPGCRRASRVRLARPNHGSADCELLRSE